MAQRGRKPKPVAAKIAAGNPGKRPLTTLVPAPAAGDMLCPQAVQRNARAFAYWKCIWPTRRRTICHRSTPIARPPLHGTGLCR